MKVDRSALILQAVERAADAGAACPSNDELAVVAGLGGSARASGIMASLERRGVISVERGSCSRVVTIVATGKRTAGAVKRPHWRLRPEQPRLGRGEAGPPLEREPVHHQIVDRDPCPRCGVRGDYGCSHRRQWA